MSRLVFTRKLSNSKWLRKTVKKENQPITIFSMMNTEKYLKLLLLFQWLREIYRQKNTQTNLYLRRRPNVGFWLKYICIAFKCYCSCSYSGLGRISLVQLGVYCLRLWMSLEQLGHSLQLILPQALAGEQVYMPQVCAQNEWPIF